MALVFKVHIQGGSDNTAPFPHSHPYTSSCKLQLAEISTAGMVMWEWCCVITTTFYHCCFNQACSCNSRHVLYHEYHNKFQ